MSDTGVRRDGGVWNKRVLMLTIGVAAMMLAAFVSLGNAKAAEAATNVLVYTGGATNPSVGAATSALEDLESDADFNVTVTGNAADFNAGNLAGYRAVVLLHTTGSPFSGAQEEALAEYVHNGGGLLTIGEAIGIHAGSSTFNALFGIANGNRIGNVDGTPQRTVEAGDRVHPATRDLPVTFTRTGQWYSYTANPTGSSHVVARVRTGSNQALSDDGMRDGSNTQPVAWCRDQQNGRTFYTGLGGSTADWSDDNFLDHITGALEWTSGAVRANCKATITSNYTSTRLVNRGTGITNSGESHGLSIADNGWVIYIGRADCVSAAERGEVVAPPTGSQSRITAFNNPNVGVGCGTVHVFDPDEYNGTVNSGVTRAATLAVYGDRGSGNEVDGKIETGLLGVTVAPDFETTGHVYLFYYPSFNPNTVPPGLEDGAERRVTKMAKGRISRFTLDMETKQLDLGSEVKIFEFESQIFSCCHRGGGMGFDSAGNLYITTGDSNSSGGNYSGNWQNVICPTGSTDPASASGTNCGNNPISYRDARRTAGSTNDYNGKMLRIKPNPAATPSTPIGVGSSYSLPTADDPNGPNLFSGSEGNGNQARPEIYAMGLRNPSRLYIDPATDIPYSAWVGPDAGSQDSSLGPAKYEVAARMRSAGNYGWPYCMGGSVDGKPQAYRDRLPDGSVRGSNAAGYVNGGAGTPGWYDCDNIHNDSVNNTGLSGALPHSTGTGKDAGKAIAANLWYAPSSGGGGCADFNRTASGVPDYGSPTSLCPYVQGGGQAIMAGPVYRYDDDAEDDSMRWPRYWDGRWFIGDQSGANNIRHGLLIEDGPAGDGKLPVWADNVKSIVTWQGGSFMDSKFGPDGAFYVQTYDGFFDAGGSVGLTRIAYTGGADTPAAAISATPTGEPGEYRFSSGGAGVAWSWDFDDGNTSDEQDPLHTFTADGQYEVNLTVTYADGEEQTRSMTVNVFADDTTPPVTTASLDPEQPGPGGTYEQGPVTVTLTADDGDGSGVDYTEYRLSTSGAWTTYEEPVNVTGNGNKIVQFRSVDLAGNTEETKSVEFAIGSGGGGSCAPQSDSFDGNSLGNKWNVLRANATNPVTVGDGHVTLPFLREAGDGDFFGDRGAAANTLLQTAPGSGSWVATAKLEHEGINVDGKAIGVVVVNSLDPNYFVKSAIQYKNSISGIWAERVLTVDNEAVIIGDETVPYPNSGALNPGGDYIWVRIVYDEEANEYSTWTSLDGETFTSYGNNVDASLFDQNGGSVQVGLFAKHDNSGLDGSGRVDAFNLVPGTADPQTPGDDCGSLGACTQESDQFDGSSLDGKWEVINPDATNPHTVADGHLTLPILPGDIYSDRPIAANTIVQPMPSDDWVATAKIRHEAIDADGKAAGLALINNINPNYVAKSAFQYKADINGRWAERVMTVNNVAQILGDDSVPWPNSGLLEPQGEYVWVRIVHDAEANEFSTWTSVDGEEFTSYGANMPASLFDQNQGLMKIGVFAKHDGGGLAGMVDIDAFNVVTGTTDPQTPGDECGGGGVAVPVTSASIEPGEPNGENGWYRTAVAVTLDAESENEIDRTEYRLRSGDGEYGEWQTYDGPVEVTETGEYVLQYRSVDVDGNEESPRSISFKIDTSDPVTTATYDPGQSVPEGPVSIGLEASDEGSGVESTEYRVDGGEWTPYEPATEVIYDGTAESLSRWLQAGPGSFVQQDGFIRSQGGLGLLWFPEEYGDFKVKVEWRDSSPANVGNSGVFVRFPDPRVPLADRPQTGPGDWEGTYCGRVGSAAADPAWVAVMCGHEIQINDHQPGEPQKTGSVYNFQPLNEQQAMVQPKGTWVEYEVQVVGQQYTIIRNGEVINEFDNSIPKESSRAGDPPTDARQFDSGFIGLQNHGSSDIVDFRKVEVVRLDAEGNEIAGPSVDGQGSHTVEYRTTDRAGNVEEVNADEVLIGVDERTTLKVVAKPKQKKVRAGKSYKAKIRVRNTGTVPATNVKVCVKSSSKKKAAINGKKSKCRTRGSLAAGKQWVPKFKVKKGAKGKNVKIRVIVTSSTAKKVQTSIRAKLRK